MKIIIYCDINPSLLVFFNFMNIKINSMKKVFYNMLFALSLVLVFSSCDEVDADCKCYDDALKGSELSETCAELVKDLNEEQLKEKSNECFGETVEDMSGAASL